MPKYVVKTDHDAMLPQPPIDYIVNNLITTSSVSVFYGEPGSKKTYSILSLAVAVVNGIDWLGFSTKKYPVLYIDEESGDSRISKRMKETMNGLFCKSTGNLFYTSLSGFKLDRKEDVIIIENEVRDRKVKLIIFDALADIMDGDENLKKDVQPIMTSLRRIADSTNSAVIIIHHTGKSGKIYR